MRVPGTVTVEFKTEGNISGKMIEPLLLIPFVENAFKHGIGSTGNTVIQILLSVSENELRFTVENAVSPGSKDETPGIGLQNVRKRLSLLYPGKHSLDIREADGKYFVNLSIRY
jgi:LytS/YehU family sensor histidine kinase